MLILDLTHLWEDLELEPRIPFGESHIFFFSKRKLTVRNDGSSKGYSIYWALNNLYNMRKDHLHLDGLLFQQNKSDREFHCVHHKSPQRSGYFIITFTHSRLIPLPTAGDFHRPYEVMKQNCSGRMHPADNAHVECQIRGWLICPVSAYLSHSL